MLYIPTVFNKNSKIYYFTPNSVSSHYVLKSKNTVHSEVSCHSIWLCSALCYTQLNTMSFNTLVTDCKIVHLPGSHTFTDKKFQDFPGPSKHFTRTFSEPGNV